MIEITEKEFRQLADYIKINYGIFLKDEKRTLLTGRLNSYLEKNDFTTFSQYFNFIVSDKTGDSVTEMVNRITTNYTYFMREQEHFTFLKNTVLPYFENKLEDRDFRTWSAGCSTGEEPYTLSFILNDYFNKNKTWDTTVLATDISNRVLTISQKGIYESKQLNTIPVDWRYRYFTRVDHEYEAVTEQIKKEVLFRRFNLISGSFNFKKSFHVIFCRNVMIYFDHQTRLDLINRFYRSTSPGGYLFIGQSESIDTSRSGYKYVKPGIYRKV